MKRAWLSVAATTVCLAGCTTIDATGCGPEGVARMAADDVLANAYGRSLVKFDDACSARGVLVDVPAYERAWSEETARLARITPVGNAPAQPAVVQAVAEDAPPPAAEAVASDPDAPVAAETAAPAEPVTEVAPEPAQAPQPVPAPEAVPALEPLPAPAEVQEVAAQEAPAPDAASVAAPAPERKIVAVPADPAPAASDYASELIARVRGRNGN